MAVNPNKFKKDSTVFINGVRWYFRLVRKPAGMVGPRARALMEDYTLDVIATKLVICYTPNEIPGRGKVRNDKGELVRIYAIFDSYIEFFHYSERFNFEDLGFYEIVFGELPQKPHFDIDIDQQVFTELYPQEDFLAVSRKVYQYVINAIGLVFRDLGFNLSLTKDVLVYSSHGASKTSNHLVINHYCHDGNLEAKAFYDKVIEKMATITGGKYINFVDHGVYSPRQQFRIVGSQKYGSKRPKMFNEKFQYYDQVYEHEYNIDPVELENSLALRSLTITMESLVSMHNDCVYLPSLIPPKLYDSSALTDLPDLEHEQAIYCLELLKSKMKEAPFTIKEIRGHIIILKRNAPSLCPICDRIHEKEHPYISLINGRISWDCRRSDKNAKKFFLGYLVVTPKTVTEDEEPENNELIIEGIDMGSPSPSPSPSPPPLPLPPLEPTKEDKIKEVMKLRHKASSVVPFASVDTDYDPTFKPKIKPTAAEIRHDIVMGTKDLVDLPVKVAKTPKINIKATVEKQLS